MKCPSRVPWRLGALFTLALSLVSLTSCGGGTAVEPFVPVRILAFGDENSVIDSTGRKYSINGLDSSTSALDCTLYPNWIQTMATAYGLVFPQCNPNSLTTTSRIDAASGATVADFKTQIDNFVGSGDFFSAKDLVLVIVGQNDVFEQYALYPNTDLDTLDTEMTARGAELAAQINRIAELGGKVVVGKLQDLSLTPYAQTENATYTTGTGRAAVIKALTTAFNNGFLDNLDNDATHIGLFDPDTSITTVVANPANGSLSNSSTAACETTVELIDCTTSTLVSGATITTYLWADDKHLAYEGHLMLAALAYARSSGNPF